MMSGSGMHRRIADRFFAATLKRKWWALWILKFSRVFSPVPKGLWLYRKGEAGNARELLEASRSRGRLISNTLQKCIEIETALGTGTFERKPSCDRQSFNRRVLFACQFSSDFDTNGYTVRTNHLAQALVDSGVHVCIATRMGYPWDIAKGLPQESDVVVELDGIRHLHRYDSDRLVFGPESAYIKAYSQYLIECIGHEQASVIHAHSSYLNGLAASIAARSCKAKSVYEMRGLWHLTRAVSEPGYESTDHFRYCELMEIRAARECDRVITISQALKEWLVSKSVNPEKITVIPNGVIPRSMPDQHSESRDNFTIGFAGSLTEYEGLDDVLRALASLKSKNRNTKMLIAGLGPYEKSLKAMVRQLGLSSEVSFLGLLSRVDIERFYRMVDAIVICRKDTPLTRILAPLKLLEAASFGIPMVVSDLSGHREMINFGRECVPCQPGCPDSIEAALISLMDSPRLARNIGVAAYSRAMKDYTWTHLASRDLEIYQSAT